MWSLGNDPVARLAALCHGAHYPSRGRVGHAARGSSEVLALRRGFRSSHEPPEHRRSTTLKHLQEDAQHWAVRRGQLPRELQIAHPRHPDVDEQTGRVLELTGGYTSSAEAHTAVLHPSKRRGRARAPRTGVSSSTAAIRERGSHPCLVWRARSLPGGLACVQWALRRAHDAELHHPGSQSAPLHAQAGGGAVRAGHHPVGGV